MPTLATSTSFWNRVRAAADPRFVVEIEADAVA
jgi:hypothetical protein